MPHRTAPTPVWHLYIPKLVTVLREGYSLSAFGADLIAGLTVAIVALPLAMALAIASGATPGQGLITSVVAGFIISAFGGSRFQIGGPTGAFVVVVFNVIATYGYDGLVLATLMAGVILVAAGLLRLGTFIRYIPETVVTGFTAGIAIIIFSSQIKDLFGLTMAEVPAEFLDKWAAFWAARDTVSTPSMAIAFGALALIVLLRRHAPKWPAFLMAVVAGSLIAWVFALPVDTIGSVFGGIPRELPAPQLPAITLARIVELLPSAFTIAFLAGVESLLSAVVADGMSGRRHRSNCEIVAQGVANIASALFGGMPATGAIARTATSIRAGARSPLAGMMHAAFILAFMMVLAPLANYIPLASLAAVLLVVAWNMSEIGKFRHLLRAPLDERLILLVTLALTVLVDLTVAIEVGVVLAAISFMHRMAGLAAIHLGVEAPEEEFDDFAGRGDGDDQRAQLPADVEVFQLRGPLFFGAASRLGEVLERARPRPPRVFILRMREVPLIDATGVGALSSFLKRCDAHGTRVVIAGIQPQPRTILEQMGLADKLEFADSFIAAKEMTATM